MRSIRLLTLAISIGLVTFYSSAAQKENNGPQKPPAATVTITGEISDSQCAYKVHSTSGSHDEMMRVNKSGNTPETCTRFCVGKMGGIYVFVRYGKTETIYHLDNEDTVATYAGRKVKARVNISADGKTLHILAISPL